jgi:hypothetical protein
VTGTSTHVQASAVVTVYVPLGSVVLPPGIRTRNPDTTRAGTPSLRASSATSVAYCSGVPVRSGPTTAPRTAAKLVLLARAPGGIVDGGADGVWLALGPLGPLAPLAPPAPLELPLGDDELLEPSSE